jgi:chemotaxis-related protein WspD
MTTKLMIEDCWNRIGVVGDRSCPELKTVFHCRNCPIYAATGRSLLEREPPPGYLQDWTDLLTQEKHVGEIHQIAPVGTISVGVFRLRAELLALPAHLLKEVTQMSVIHTLPHRSNNIFLGLVNTRGEIQMCVSLSALLGIEIVDSTPQKGSSHVNERMVVVEKEGSRWVFPVDEIYGIHRIHPDELGNVPTTISKVPETYTKGVIAWQSQKVSFLDDDLLFYTLNKKVL